MDLFFALVAKLLPLYAVMACGYFAGRKVKGLSTRAHLSGKSDGLVDVSAMKEFVPVWTEFLSMGIREDELESIRAGERTGRPLGSDKFVGRLERKLDRTLSRQKHGPKPQKKKAA